VELIEGEIVEMPPIGDRHRLSVDRLTNLIAPQLVTLNAFVSVQQPLPLDQRTEPQPDVIIAEGKPEDYARHPRVEHALLVIEVADSTLTYDRQRKVPLYSRAGVCEVWVVNLTTNSVEVFRAPTAAGYTFHALAMPG